MAEYNNLQIKEITIFAKLSHIDTDTAAMEWVRRGLAAKFAAKYRTRFGLSTRG